MRNEETGLRAARDYAPLGGNQTLSGKLKGAVGWFLRPSVALSAQDACYN